MTDPNSAVNMFGHFLKYKVPDAVVSHDREPSRSAFEVMISAQLSFCGTLTVGIMFKGVPYQNHLLILRVTISLRHRNIENVHVKACQLTYFTAIQPHYLCAYNHSIGNDPSS